MTEKWIEEQFLASDVWGIEKSPPDLSPEETLAAWKQAVKVLDHLSNMADALMSDPLILALVDAKVRAEEELEKARDRAEMGEPGKLPRSVRRRCGHRHPMLVSTIGGQRRVRCLGCGALAPAHPSLGEAMRALRQASLG